MNYYFEVSGTGVDGHTWIVEGYNITSVEPNAFGKVLAITMERTFMALTEGKAIYGQPGKACKGPYKITKFLIKAQE